jgi:hypothetical protein
MAEVAAVAAETASRCPAFSGFRDTLARLADDFDFDEIAKIADDLAARGNTPP